MFIEVAGEYINFDNVASFERYRNEVKIYLTNGVELVDYHKDDTSAKSELYTILETLKKHGYYENTWSFENAEKMFYESILDYGRHTPYDCCPRCASVQFNGVRANTLDGDSVFLYYECARCDYKFDVFEVGRHR